MKFYSFLLTSGMKHSDMCDLETMRFLSFGLPQLTFSFSIPTVEVNNRWKSEH